MTANLLFRRVPPVVRVSASRTLMSPVASKKSLTNPPSLRMIRHASVLMRKLVKKGAMTRMSMMFFHRPAFCAMKYASG